MITKLIRTTIITLSLIILSEILRYYKVYSTLIQNTESRFINNPIILSATIAIIALLAGSYLWNSKKNVLPNQNLGYIAFSFIGLSIYYFFCIYPFFKSEYFLALFIFLIIIIGIKIIHIINKNKSDKIVEKNDLSDNSIKTPSEDKYEYYISAENLLKRILAAPHYFKDRSLCVGIEASWGHGKTSYLNLIEYSVTVDKESVNYNKAIIIKFNAWMSSSNQQLTENFMATLSEVLTPYNPNITSKIAHYSRTLSNADLGWLSKIVKIVTPPIETSLEKQFEDLSNCIGEIDKPIIVYIDDIDRLFFTEIMGVLKLIRNTASFKNTIFVVPYDRDYVVKQLKQNNISEEYLEKMFNLPYSLPPLNQEKKNLIYKDIICNALSVNEKNKEQVDDFLEAVNENFTLRAIKRFLNIIQVKRSYLDSIELGDLFLFDLLIMEYIRLKYFNAYEKLNQNYDILVQNKNDNRIDIRDEEEGHKIELKDLYNYSSANRAITKDEWCKCSRLLELIFRNSTEHDSISIASQKSKDPYRLKNLSIFKAYFNEITPIHKSAFITLNEFNKIKDSTIDFNKSTFEWFNKKDSNLIYRLFEDISFENEQEGLYLLNSSFDYMIKNKINIFIVGLNNIESLKNETYLTSFSSFISQQTTLNDELAKILISIISLICKNKSIKDKTKIQIQICFLKLLLEKHYKANILTLLDSIVEFNLNFVTSMDVTTHKKIIEYLKYNIIYINEYIEKSPKIKTKAFIDKMNNSIVNIISLSFNKGIPKTDDDKITIINEFIAIQNNKGIKTNKTIDYRSYLEDCIKERNFYNKLACDNSINEDYIYDYHMDNDSHFNPNEYIPQYYMMDN